MCCITRRLRYIFNTRGFLHWHSYDIWFTIPVTIFCFTSPTQTVSVLGCSPCALVYAPVGQERQLDAPASRPSDFCSFYWRCRRWLLQSPMGRKHNQPRMYGCVTSVVARSQRNHTACVGFSRLNPRGFLHWYIYDIWFTISVTIFCFPSPTETVSVHLARQYMSLADKRGSLMRLPTQRRPTALKRPVTLVPCSVLCSCTRWDQIFMYVRDILQGTYSRAAAF